MCRKIILCCVAVFIILGGCRKKGEEVGEGVPASAVVVDIPEDGWIALRIAHQDKGMAGFLVPPAVDHNDPDWIFCHGIYCRDVWDMKRVIKSVIKDKSIITKNAISCIPKNNSIFEDYKQSIEVMLEGIKGIDAPTENRLPPAKGGAAFLAKFIGQESTTAGLVLPHTNMLHTLDFMLEESFYVSDILEIYKYFPIKEVSLMVVKLSNPTPLNQLTKNLSSILEGYTKGEILLLKKTLKVHGGKEPNFGQ